MTEIEKKVESITSKWRSKMLEQNITDFYKFYRNNKVMVFEDLSDLWDLCKLQELFGGELYE